MPDTASHEGTLLAARFRKEHAVPTGSLDLITQIPQLPSVDILTLTMPDKLDALVLHDPHTDNTVIGIATSYFPYRQNFTLAHEVGHIVAGDIDLGSSIHRCPIHNPRETRADSFARNLLCPLECLPEDLETEPEQLLSDTVRRYKVSPQVAAIQLQRRGLIDASTESRLRRWSASRLATEFGWREQYETDRQFARQERPSARLVEDATALFRNGRGSLNLIAGARRMSLKDVETEFDDPPRTGDPMAELDVLFADEHQ